MGIYFKDISVLLIDENDLITEDYFSKEVSKIKISIMIRDCSSGKAAKSSPHVGSPSIKVFDGFGGSKSHSIKGDPIYFSRDKEPIFEYKGKNNLNKIERKYLENFIIHNYLNLLAYWFAPIKCENEAFCRELQHEIKRRIQTNINKYEYDKGTFYTDSPVELSIKMQQKLNINRGTII